MSNTEQQILMLFRRLDSKGKQQFHDLVQAMSEINRSHAKQAEAAKTARR